MRAVAFTLFAMTACLVFSCVPEPGDSLPSGGDDAARGSDVTPSGGDVSDNTGGNGNEVNWDLPNLPSLAEEQAAIADTLTGMKNALTAGDMAAVAQLVAPKSRDAYKASLEQNPELMSMLASALESAQLMSVSEDDRAEDYTSRRFGNVEIEYDGIIFHATVVKVDGTWLFVKF